MRGCRFIGVLWIVGWVGASVSCVSFLDGLLLGAAHKIGLEERMLLVGEQSWFYRDNLTIHSISQSVRGGEEWQARSPMVLIHGFGGGSLDLAFFATQFSDVYLILPDLPDLSFHYAEEPLNRPVTLENQAHRLHEFLMELREEVGYDKVFLLGFSIGGTIAGLYSIFYPDYVEKAILIGPMAGAYKNDFLDTTRRSNLQNIAVLPRSHRDHELAANAVFSGRYHLPFFVYAYMGFKSVPLYHRQWAIFTDIYFHDGPFPLEEKWKELQVPVLLIWGERDQVFPVSVAERAEEQSPYVSKIIYPNAGHAVFVKKEKQIVREVRRYMGLSETLSEPMSP